MKFATVAIFLMVLALNVSAQHLSAPPQYNDQKVLNHLEDLANQLKAVRKSELNISFNGWSNPDVQAAAEKHSTQNFHLIQSALSNIDDIRAAGTYSIRDLFWIYAAAAHVESTAESFSSEVSVYKRDGRLGAEILGAATDLSFSMSDLEGDIELALNVQGDMLMTLQTQACKQ
jgi:hypothetical protein